MSFEEDSEAWTWQDLAGDSSLALSDLLNDFDLTQGEEISADSQGSREPESSSFAGVSPPLKRRRMLQFSEAVRFEDKQNGGFEDHSGDLQMSDPVGSDSFLFCRNEDLSGESLENSSETWMAGCINEGEMPDISDDPNASGGFDDQIDISEFCNLLQPGVDADTPQAQIGNPPSDLPAGKQKTRGKVTYPFALIKPCGVQGDVTLNDINHKISSTSTLLQVQDCTRAKPVHKSAISGKTVVACTKVHTEGNGSIIIMRTRG
ncbi:protein XRI1 isoform X1 [Cryptomeria japonica]|uniref:protein XRI1 isoform X1 n=1 Tax=Cryptomeria japonica TaxID=3369 RepID=UPI0025AB996B|nr:protein XRI1 isoform X1 [Cryptomeria japonica]